MPVRLTKPYEGQAANTLWWGSTAMENTLRGAGLADDQIELASDYESHARIVTAATANTSRNATTYRMRSSSAQTLTIAPSGYWQPGQEIRIIQEGTGATTLVAASGVTLAPNVLAATAGQYGVARLIKGWGETWDIVPSSDAANSAAGVTAYNVTRQNTAKLRMGLGRLDRNMLIIFAGPSTSGGQTTPVAPNNGLGAYPNRIATNLQSAGVNANANAFFGCHGFYGQAQTIANLVAGDNRISVSGGTVAGNFLSAGGNCYQIGAGGTMTFTPTTNVRKWKIYSGNTGAGRNFTASSGASGSVAVNSIAGNTITETIIDAGSAGLNALTLTNVLGTPSILGVYGYDDTGGKTEVCILNWSICGARCSQFNENIDTGGRATLPMIGKVAADAVFLEDMMINEWRQSRPVAQAKADYASVIASYQAAGTEVYMATSRPDGGALGASADQLSYVNAEFELAREFGIPLFDNRASFVSFAVAQANGMYSDEVHPSQTGNVAVARTRTQQIQRIVGL